MFFITAAKLVPEDTDEVDDVYDAHECTSASPCTPPREVETPPVCETTAACRYLHAPDATLGAPASAALGAPGNTSSSHAVLSNQEHHEPKPTSKPPTRAQRLAKALHACRSKDKHHKHKRLACERAAHKRYAAPAKSQEAKNAPARSHHGAPMTHPRPQSPQGVHSRARCRDRDSSASLPSAPPSARAQRSRRRRARRGGV